MGIWAQEELLKSGSSTNGKSMKKIDNYLKLHVKHDIIIDILQHILGIQ